MRNCGLLLAFAAIAANAQTYPQPGSGDPRIQTVIYDPAQVIRLSVAPGLQTLVELAPGETVQTIGVADSAAWQVSPSKRGDILFVKNVSAGAMTNMSVVTAARVYNFELAPSGSYGEVSAYHVKLVYPSKAPEAVAVETEVQFEYRISGSRIIRPSDVYQQGSRTIIEWPEETELPGVFTLRNGNETLVNGEMQNGRFVIPGNPEKFVFRLDRQTAYATRRAMKVAAGE